METVQCPYCKGKGRIVIEASGNLTTISVNKALVEIAKQQDGLLVAKHAIRILVKAGVFATPADANDNIYSTLRRSAYFQKESRGIYRLKVSPRPATVKEEV